MAAGDVTFKTLYFGPINPAKIDTATATGAGTGTTNNKTIVAEQIGNNLLIRQIRIADA